MEKKGRQFIHNICNISWACFEVQYVYQICTRFCYSLFFCHYSISFYWVHVIYSYKDFSVVALALEYNHKIATLPGGHLNKKDGLTRYGDSHVKDKTS